MSIVTGKNIIRLILIIGTIASLALVPWPLVWAWLKPLPDTMQEQAEEAIEHGFDGIILYVDQKGMAPEFYSAGWHDTKNKIPSRADALFKIASISKLYHALAITKLIQKDSISIDGTLADYMPELVGRVENAEQITIQMMVQHRSGIPNYTDTYYYWATPKESNQERLDLVLDKAANFAPGDDYEYSNTNYLLLGEIMDRVLGYDHFQFIQQEILDRLELHNTYASIKNVNIEDVMSGYYIGHPYDLKTDDQGMVATAEDVGIFLRALNEGKIFDEGEQEIYSSLYEYEHTGLVPGYQSIAKYHPELDAVIIQFTNTVDFEGYQWNLSEIIYSRFVKILKKENNR